MECEVCGLSLSSSAAVGAMRTALQGSGAGASSTNTIVVGGAAARVGRVFGSYRLLEVLGEGGMGAVYLAEHVKLGRKVALKMLHPHYADTPEIVRRFFAEARAVNKIFHDHIVEITDFVENEHGLNYFIMEYLKGVPLGDLIEQEGAMPLSRSIGIIVQVCSALRVVHEAGIVHRDLKPDNIFITEKGGQRDFVKVLDFGIAKLLDADGKTINLQTTAAGMIMGTPEYMSPEQARGKEIDYRTDIYSLGVILYELATGRKPFQADTFGEMVVAHSVETPIMPSKVDNLFQDIPRKLDELIMQCLEKEPQKRPQSTQEIEDRLREVATTHQVQLERFDLTARVMSTGSRRWLVAGLAAAIAVAAVAIPLLSSDGSKRNTRSTPTAQPEAKAARREAAPTPVVEPVAAAPEKVSLTLHSVPPGASVFIAGETEPLGVTPLSKELDRTDGQMTFEFRMAGFQTVTQSVSLARDAQVAVALAADTSAKSTGKRRKSSGSRQDKTEASASTKPKGKPGYKDGAVMNPFD